MWGLSGLNVDKNKCKPLLKGGAVPDYMFNKAELAMGTKVEMEHTNDPNIAKQIAKAHLLERSDYYQRLKKAKL